LGDIHENAFLHGEINNWTGWNTQLDCLNHAAAASLYHDVDFLLQATKFLGHVGASPLDLCEQSFLFDHGEVLECDAARQRTATKGRSVLPCLDLTREALARRERA